MKAISRTQDGPESHKDKSPRSTVETGEGSLYKVKAKGEKGKSQAMA